MSRPRPIVAAATACDQVIVGKDDVASIIRMVDVYYIRSDAPAEGARIKLRLFLGMRSGDVVGEHDVGLQFRAASGKPQSVQVTRVSFPGGAAGANIVVDADIAAEEGQHWFDVLWYGDVLTSIPVRIERRAEP